MAQTRKPAIPLTTFSMRVSPHQMKRLDQLRARTLLPITEHIRRAIDLYLAKVEKGESPVPIVPIAGSLADPPGGSTAPKASPKSNSRVASRINYR